jgi:hypothetical protein
LNGDVERKMDYPFDENTRKQAAIATERRADVEKDWESFPPNQTGILTRENGENEKLVKCR